MAIPTKIGRYEIKSELGRGGMATVYRGYDPSFDREVAIKVLPREMMHDPQFRTRFEREIKMVAGLEHPSIVPVYDVGDEDGQPYFVMRYMTGGSLSDMIDKGKASLQDTARIVERIALGLNYAHKKGIVHRDLKPDNILFDENGDPFISDFGVAKLTESTGNLTGSGVIGTPAYMSPEQAQGTDIDGRSDVYGLGVIVYQLLSGSQPYNADTPMGVVVKHITEPVPEILKMIPDLPREADEVIKLSMAKDRNKRYPTAVDLAKAMNMLAFGNEGNISASGTGLNTGVHKAVTIQSSRTRTGLIVAGVVVLVVAVGIFLLRNQLFASPQPEPTLVAAPTEAPTEAPTSLPTDTPAPTETLLPSPLPFAPACSPANSLPVPSVEETSNICVQKVPYTGVTITEGATFETLDSNFSCIKERTSNGKTIISCRGIPSYLFDLKVCLPPMLTPEESNKCGQGSMFNAANQCCAVIPPEGAGCTIAKVSIKSCP